MVIVGMFVVGCWICLWIGLMRTMKNQNGNSPVESRALLAITLAIGVLNSPQPARAVDDNNDAPPAVSVARLNTSESIIQKVGESSELSPEYRALTLLKLANSYLSGTSSSLETSYRNGVTPPLDKMRWDWRMLDDWVSTCARDPWAATLKAGIQAASPHEKILANQAMDAAMTQLRYGSNLSQRLKLYYLIGTLSGLLKGFERQRNCERILNSAIVSCEKSSTSDESRLKAISDLLNIKANQFLYVNVDGERPFYTALAPENQPAPVVPKFEEKDFAASQALRLRGLVLLDRLAPSNHYRRKAHRDMSLWYRNLGKETLATRQKDILFKLIGVSDERLLYPSSLGCGQFTWWVVQQDGHGVRACGMG